MQFTIKKVSNSKEKQFNVIFNNPEYFDEYRDNIYIFQQFYIPKDQNRRKEINQCLNNNVKNKFINKIILLNEREYTKEEMDLNDDEIKKIQQIVISKRLKYSIFFEIAKNFQGYTLLSNSDIFFDESIENIFKTSLYYKRSCFTQNRIEHNKKLFGPRSDSQDAWLFHSKHLTFNSKNMDFELGMPGCYNKITFLLAINRYKLFNEPFRIKVNHLHTSNVRGYSGKDIISPPYLMIHPYMKTKNIDTENFTNIEVKKYILDKLNNNEKIYIPTLDIDSISVTYENLFSYNIQKNWDNLMKNSKIFFNNIESFKMFIMMYNDSIINTELLIDYDNNTTINNLYLKTNKIISPTKFTFNRDYIKITKKEDIKYHFITSLENKKILIINDNINIYKSNLNKELLKNCEIFYLQVNITMQPWLNNYINICKQLKEFEGKFEIALVDCYGYSNLITYYIYNNMNNSSISLHNNLNFLIISD